MDKITEHFTREEFDCKDGRKVPQSLRDSLKELCDNLEILRKEVGRPIVITSGFRTPSWNKKQGGAPLSQHLMAKAADFHVKDINPATLATAINRLIIEGKMKPGGVGIYDSWVHYDTRGKFVTWDLRKNK